MSTPSISSRNITWHAGAVSREDRERAFAQRGATIWFTGLSGAGKSTIARAVEEALFRRGRLVYVLDGDNIRHGLNRDLGFSPKDREENIRRIGEVARLFVDAGCITLVAFISPYRADRDAARSIHDEGRFVEAFVRCTVEECERRDTKGLWKKAREGKIPEFTGVSAPYDEPLSPEIVLDTAREPLEACVGRLLSLLEERGIIGR